MRNSWLGGFQPPNASMPKQRVETRQTAPWLKKNEGGRSRLRTRVVRGGSGRRGSAGPTRARLGSRGSGGLEGLFALAPVARAQLVALQRVEHAQHFVRIAADRTGGDVDELDLAVRIDDE